MSAKEKIARENDVKSEVVDYDELLVAAGDFGRYQLGLFLSTFPFYVLGSFSYFTQLFLTETSPDYWCMVPELQNVSISERKKLAIPWDVNAPFGYSQCHMYQANWTEVLVSGVTPNETSKIVPCQYGWEFDTTEFPYPTISSELGWVCDKNSYAASAQSIFFVGSIFGGFLIGWVSDRFGRLPATVASNLAGAIAGIASIFATNFVQFAVCRFFMGISYDNCMMMIYILLLEYIVPKYRTVITNMAFAVFFTIGAVALPWIALACGDWRTLSLATSVPMAFTLLAPFLLPESPRWLLSKDRVDDAVTKVLNIARVNKKQVPQSLIEKFKRSTKNNKEVPENIIDMMKRPLLRKLFICACIEFMCCILIFDSLIRTIGQLKFDFFISFSVISVTELPSLVLLSFIMDYTGRKPLLMVALLLASVFSYLIPFVGGGWQSVLCAVAARFVMNMACNTAMQWAAEMLPTSVRGSGSSIIHSCGYIATVISPFVAYLEIYYLWLPMVVVGTTAIFAAFISITLPETAKRDMPQTFDDAEILINSQGYFDFPCRRKKQIGHVQGCANESFEFN